MRTTLRRPFGVLLSAACLLACGTTHQPADETTNGTTATAADTSAGPTTSVDTDASTGPGTDASTGPGTGGTSDPGEALCQADLQDCPDGFKCVLRRGAADWEFVCLPVQGDNQPGDSCHHDGVIAGTDDCDEESWCIGSFDTTGAPWEGLCYPLCVGDVCGTDERCVSIGALPVCAPLCDPLLAVGCTADEACIFREPEGFVCFPQGVDGHAIGEDCETAISCAPGLHCSQRVVGCPPDSYCCTDYCDTQSAENTCTAKGMGATCEAIGATAPEQAHVGACVIPE
ncbi:hypothetical protein SAMN02745121_01898 [Nannocystis exedens]|uniref:Uncharacterized protein n=1 Tax=Nannocystis exedens TaxID=54 RepID=A0A1I1VRL9_9BACT|nr:hypothetical protein [Nannocystis exedens]PCC72782.1 hypothetical protein NAEX_05867 [Nannocystis exedens]SFD85676.1 hypothetical protein SAMN02745121_01898 [Nannocystis exedens]